MKERRGEAKRRVGMGDGWIDEGQTRMSFLSGLINIFSLQSDKSHVRLRATGRMIRPLGMVVNGSFSFQQSTS